MTTDDGSSSSSTPPPWQMIEQILCNSCFEILGRGKHQPKVIDCYHTLCKACVEKKIADGKIKCPFCSKITPCPSGSSDEIFTNHDRTRLVEQLLKMCRIQPCPLSFCETCRQGAVEMCRLRCHKVHFISEEFRKYLIRMHLLRRTYDKETRH